MANIKVVDYEAFPEHARQIRELGKQLNTELISAYTNIEKMHEFWYGKRYNRLINEFNNMIPQLNAILTLVVGEVPYTLEMVANNYSQADKEANVTYASNEVPIKITELSEPNDVGARFLLEGVMSIQERISLNLKKAKQQMNEIDNVYTKIVWESDAATAFKTAFRSLKNNITLLFDNVESSFTELMNQTQQELQAVERANTNNA